MVRGREGARGECGWGLCVSGRGKRKTSPQPGSRSLRTAFEVNANREEVDRGADTPLFGFKMHPVLPPSYEHFDTSLFPVSPYREILANRPTETQALMQNRRRACS